MKTSKTVLDLRNEFQQERDRNDFRMPIAVRERQMILTDLIDEALRDVLQDKRDRQVVPLAEIDRESITGYRHLIVGWLCGLDDAPLTRMFINQLSTGQLDRLWRLVAPFRLPGMKRWRTSIAFRESVRAVLVAALRDMSTTKGLEEQGKPITMGEIIRDIYGVRTV